MAPRDSGSLQARRQLLLARGAVTRLELALAADEIRAAATPVSKLLETLRRLRAAGDRLGPIASLLRQRPVLATTGWMVIRVLLRSARRRPLATIGMLAGAVIAWGWRGRRRGPVRND